MDILDVALQLIASLREPVERLGRQDRELAVQVRKAASSIALNVSEGRRREGRDRLHFFRIASGSAAEVGTGLDVAVGWGWLADAELAQARSLLDRVRAMAWRLTHPH